MARPGHEGHHGNAPSDPLFQAELVRFVVAQDQ